MKKLFCALILLGVFSFTGCFALPTEEEPLPPPITAVPEARVLRTLEVERGDVVLSSSPSTMFIPAQQEVMHFTVAGRRIRGVFVSLGDEVQAGDILAELDNPYLLDQLRDTKWEEEWTLLHLEQLAERLTFSRRQPGFVETPYANERARLEGELELIRMRIAHLENEIDEMQIRAPFDGVITWVMEFGGIMWSGIGQPVVTVSGQGEYVFRLIGSDADYITLGDEYTLTLGGDAFPAIAIDAEAEGVTLPATATVNVQDAFFRIVGEDTPVIVGSAFATVFILQDLAEDVVFLPIRLINTVGDRTFVHVLEDDIIVIRDIEIGLQGNSNVEILSGLEEGDLVVL